MIKPFLINIFLLLVILTISNEYPNLKKGKKSFEVKSELTKTDKPAKIVKKPQRYYEDLIEKGIRLDNLTRGSPPPPYYEKINYKKDKILRKRFLQNLKKSSNLRKLSETQFLENVGFINLYTNLSYAYRFLMSNVKKQESKFILYPYPFNYKERKEEGVEEEKQVENGGVFALNQSQLEDGKFDYLVNISSVEIKKAKGLYDIDIGIMSLVYEFNGRETDLFTEASSYCEYFVNTLNKISSCLNGKNEYLEYKQRYPNRGAILRVSNVDLLNNTLYDNETQQLKVSMLIFSDYLTGNEETIFDNYLGADEIEIIKKFRELGGHIVASGKSGYLLEKMGIIPDDTYDTSFTLHTKDRNYLNKIVGCNDIYKQTPEEQPDYFKQLICMRYPNKTYLSQTFTMKSIPSNFDSLISYENKDKNLFKKTDGRDSLIDDENARFDYILASHEETGKGRIMLINGNPIQNKNYIDNFRNMLLYCMTKNIIYDLKIQFSSSDSEEEDYPIPAGEEGVQLKTSFKFYNLDDRDLSDISVDILFVSKIEIVTSSIVEGCSIVEDADKYKDLNIAELNTSRYLRCIKGSLERLTNFVKTFKLEITDYTITQKLNDIPLMYSLIYYKDEGKDANCTPGMFYAQAEIAAVLRATINKDPSSAYPMKGEGLYFDLVIDIENKENTEALDVKYVSVIPLIGPLFDGVDENSVAHVIPLYEEYYEKHNYSYPWIDYYVNREDDYIDYAEVAGKNVCYVADFDTPIKRGRRTREELEGVVKDLYHPTGTIVPDETSDITKSANPNSLLRQLYFADNEKFYETAAPRISLFIDTATDVGAAAMYGPSIPENVKDPHHPTRAKTKYAFIRLDTYFYPSSHGQYQYPNGFNDSILISLDKYDQRHIAKTGNKFGDIRKRIINKGYYNSSRPKLDRLKENEYSNSMREYSYLKQYDPTDPTQFEELKSLTNDTIKLSHFMVPCDDDYIQRAGSIDGFVENVDGSGYLEQYPSLKFVYGFDIDLILAPEKSRIGGMVEILLGSDVDFSVTDPIEQDSVTLSADNVAFYKIEYEQSQHKITVYFKRGLMPNENYGLPSKCRVFLENLNKNENFTVTFKLYSLKFDFSKETLEDYIFQEEWTELAVYKTFFSFPCLIMENTLRRKSSFSTEASSSMYEYEIMNPFARYGGYYQELTKHTTVFGSGEAHHRTDPGFQSTSGGFSVLGNIGTSPIPAAEFLSHGKLFIPGVTSTSRIEWTDIWGRRWAQNLRSIYPDIPPVPPGPLNFIMTTTFEMLTNDREQNRVLEWQSDESLYIWIQMKIMNTYALYWEPTICLNNQRPFIKENYVDYRNPAFENFTEDLEGVDDTYDVNVGFSSVYGVCYNEDSYIGGQKLNSSIVEEMNKMMMCAATEDADLMSECSRRADELRLPLVKRKPENAIDTTPNENWNYSPLIESYLPDGYIYSKHMWQLNLQEDYYDDSFYKGFPFHLDDNIPNIDNGNTKPHDIIQFPIFKGLGYSITYDRNYAIKKFPKYKGWWSDQLQNKDHTLLAGQQKVNRISVNETKSLIDDRNWINIKDLKYKDKTNLANNKLKNLYVCMFNQHRVKVTPGQTKYAFLKNVYQNNVVPILPDLKEYDPRYYNFDCTGENAYQYSIYNISKVDNRVYTGNDRDWLYFAAGLRANAKENINVILKLDPLQGSLYEGITKIQDGGRFIYWEPPDGPNSYQYYDGNVNTIIAKRVDLTLNHRMIPTELYTFNSYGYQLFTIEDKREENREYTMNSYMNSHGYGDATTTVYVGGIDATSCKVQPGTFTYVKITFYNNAGFDWEMKDDGIELDEAGYGLTLNAMSLMLGKITAIQYPRKYNFMSYIIPEELEGYITLTPSQHVIDVSPQFFDLTFNNILTIKDAFEGDYFYCLNVTEDFPEEYKGKLWEIKMVINEEYFKTLPGVNDPTGIHNYHLTIPSIRFGVPISDGKYKNKVFYNLGQANDMVFTYKLHKNFKYQGAKILEEEDITKLNDAVSNKNEHFEKLLEVWDSINHYPEKDRLINVTSAPKDNFYQLMTVNLSKAFPLFPYEQQQAPFVSKIYVLIKTFSENVPFGSKSLLSGSQIKFNDSRKIKTQNVEYPSSISCYASGPSFYPEFETKIIKYNDSSSDYYEVEKQEIFEGDVHTLRLTLSTTNEGTADAYTPAFSVGVNSQANYIPSDEYNEFLSIRDEGIVNNMRIISIKYNGNVHAGTVQKFDLKFEMQFGEKKEFDSRRSLEEATNKSIKLVESLNITLCLSDIACHEGDTNFGRQITEKDYNVIYSSAQRAVGSISLTSENLGTDLVPKYVLTVTIDNILPEYSSKQIKYSFQRKIEGRDSDYVELALTEKNNYTDEPFKEGEIENSKKYQISYRVIGYLEDGRTLDSLNKNMVSFSYILAEKEAEKVDEETKEENEVEEESKKKGFPLYALIIIIIASIAIILIAAYLIYKYGCKKREIMITEEVPIVKQKYKFEGVNADSKTNRRTISNKKRKKNELDPRNLDNEPHKLGIDTQKIEVEKIK